MAYNLKEVVKKKTRFTSGHRMCAGCGAPTTVRAILSGRNDDAFWFVFSFGRRI